MKSTTSFSRSRLARLARLAAIVLITPAASASFAQNPARKKFIELGWDIPTTRQMRDHWREMEKAPFDGVIFRIETRSPTAVRCDTQAFWQKARWSKDWFSDAADDLKSCKFEKFTDNFLRLNATPGNLDWFDDDAWAQLCENAAIMAALMRDTSCKGLCLDFESYGARQFQFDPARGRRFPEVSAAARQRGSQFMRSIARAYPSITIFTLFMNSVNLQAGASDDPNTILATHVYGLLPAFVDGMFDSGGPQIKFVDGIENAYRYDGREAYLAGFNQVAQLDGPAARLVSPANRAKHRAQVQVGFGFYLDAYINSPTSPWYIGGHGGSRLERLQYNLGIAREVADEYVWVYGEQARWWLPGKSPLWEDRLPGITRAIAWAKDPRDAAGAEVEQLRQRGELKNLLDNGGFDKGVEGKPPDGYSVWQNEKRSKGTMAWDQTVGRTAKGSARAVKVADGCFLRKHSAKPGELYAVEASCQLQGNSAASLLVRWQDENGRWTLERRDQRFAFTMQRSAWSRCFGVVEVPEGAAQLVVLLCVHNQLTDSDVCWFDDVGLYRLPGVDSR